MTTKLELLEVEVNKINLGPGDVLLVKVRGPDFESDEVCEGLKQSLKKVFPNNHIGVLFMDNNEIDLTVITQESAKALETAVENKENSCNSGNYCVDCNCGKKARALKSDLPPGEAVDEKGTD